jgi:hypothetical protein
LGNVDYFLVLIPTLPDGTERQLLVNDLLRYYSNVEDWTIIKALLSNESDINSKLAYADILLDEGNITAAISVIDFMPSSSPE